VIRLSQRVDKLSCAAITCKTPEPALRTRAGVLTRGFPGSCTSAVVSTSLLDSAEVCPWSPTMEGSTRTEMIGPVCPSASLGATISSVVATPPESLQIPFDFSRSSIGLDVTVRGTPLYVILDTGVDPSVIDLARAEALGLKIDRPDGGEASGFGDAKGARVFPSSIDNLVIGGHSFAPIDALASDMSALSAHYGRKLDAVLGYSFLADKIVLIDYPRQTLGILNQTVDAMRMVGTCRTHWSTPLRTVESFPVITNFRLGAAKARITLDTGSNGGLALYQSALDLQGVRAALSEKNVISFAGARGDGKAKSYTFNAPVGFGPFTLPPGEVVTVRNESGSDSTRVANVGNALFAAMKLKMLLNYRGRTMTFYGDCS